MYADAYSCAVIPALPPAPPPPSSSPPTTTPSAPSPTPAPAPSPPVTENSCSYYGVYRIQSVKCTSHYLATMSSCTNSTVVLRTLNQVSGNRVRFTLNSYATGKQAKSAPVASLRQCPGKYLTGPSGTRQPTLGGSSWRYQIVPTGDGCDIVNFISGNRASDQYLGVNDACNGFTWYADGNATNTAFRAVRS